MVSGETRLMKGSMPTMCLSPLYLTLIFNIFTLWKRAKLGGNEINLVDHIGRQFMGDGSWWGLEQIADDLLLKGRSNILWLWSGSYQDAEIVSYL